MQLTTRCITRSGHLDRQLRPLLAVAVVLLVCFLLAPWPLQAKALATLHGLCVQQPSHSFWFGNRRLPLDARMSGMYLGFLTAQLALARLRGRRPVALPKLRYILLLFGFMVAMALDGTNSTLADLGLPSLYPPSNALRYLTGALAGVSLAVYAWVLLSLCFPGLSRGTTARLVRSPAELLALVLPALAAGLLLGSGIGWLYAPEAVLLICCCLLTLGEMALAGIGLVVRRAASARSLIELAGPATVAGLLACLTMAALSLGRFVLEAHI